jgi:hypothetical protein
MREIQRSLVSVCPATLAGGGVAPSANPMALTGLPATASAINFLTISVCSPSGAPRLSSISSSISAAVPSEVPRSALTVVTPSFSRRAISAQPGIRNGYLQFRFFVGGSVLLCTILRRFILVLGCRAFSWRRIGPRSRARI